MRKIFLWSPVIIWPEGFDQEYQKQKKEYMSNTLLHPNSWPPNMNVNGGAIIDLNNDSISAFHNLTLASMINSDESLI